MTRFSRRRQHPPGRGSLVDARAGDGGRVAVFAPSPLLTVTIEPGSDRPEVHLHAGGQGVWVGRLAATLGADVVLCCAVGGEPGRVLRALVEAEPFTLTTVRAGDAEWGLRA